jgi:hypothetical protein
MALVDPNIAMSYRGIELPNQLAQYGQVQEIQNAQRQNKLADLQMQEYERARAEEEGVRNYLSGADLADPTVRAGLARFGKTGLGYSKALAEQETAGLTRQKTQLEVDAKKFENQNKRLDFIWHGVGAAATPQNAIDYITQGVKDGNLSMVQGSAEIKRLQNISQDDFRKYKIENVLKVLDAKEKLAQFKQTIKDTDLGGYIERRIEDAQGMPIGAPQQLRKTPTIGEQNSAADLKFRKDKEMWDRANPGFELKENADGTFYAIDKRTKKATLITIDDGAPVAPASNAFSLRLPPTAAPAVTQVIPGMPSVLDQRAPVAPVAAAPATPMAGTPLRGKGTAMTDTQHNAALFGGAMAQAQNTIQQIEQSGTNKSVAVVPGLLTGLVNLAPFGAGEGFANAIEATFRADPTRLLGPDADQQKLAQAQLAFATAYLRKTSGAAFGASEVANTIKEFFPLRGEPDALVKQKAASRERVVKGMALGTTAEGRKYIEEAAGNNDPLGLR